MSKEKVFLKIPENFQDKVFIHPPLIKEVVGNDSFPIYRHLLTISQEELEDEYIKKKKGNDFNEYEIKWQKTFRFPKKC